MNVDHDRQHDQQHGQQRAATSGAGGAKTRAVMLRLRGPLQSWGIPFAGDDRPTNLFPTRSGVLGLVAACLGVDCADYAGLSDLARGARTHVRVDAPGHVMVDDQTIEGCPRASDIRQTIQSKRGHLADASFLVALVSTSVPPERIVEALRWPTYPPRLGRRACPPSLPILVGVAEGATALDLFEGIPREPAELVQPGPVDYYLDEPDHPLAIRHVRLRDVPDAPSHRTFGVRTVSHVQV